MPTQMLYEKTVKNAKADNGKRTVIWDDAVSSDASLPGSFGLRVTPNGVKSWIIMYRMEAPKHPGKMKQQYRKIGSYPALSLADARNAARDALMMVGRDIDPIEAREKEKRDVAAVKTVAEAVDAFIRRHAKQKNRSWQEVERVFRVYVVPKLGERPVSSISPSDIHDILDALMDAGHPYMANRLFAHTRKFFNWCSERHWIEEPPTKHIARPANEQARDRILNDEEIRSLWEACGQMGWPFGPHFKLLILTGQRRNEVAGMKWEHLDLDNKLWTLPREETKANRQHQVPLSQMALDILASAPKSGHYIFSTTGKTPISGFSKAKKRCDEIMAADENAIPAWRLHDLRRSTASGMAEIGIAPHVIEKVLNHSTGQISGVAAVYNRHTYLREKTDALNAWARALEAIVHAGDSNVVEMSRR
jgi:integrase